MSPAPDKVRLAVFTSAISVQLLPFHCSTLDTFVVVYPVAAIDADVVPKPGRSLLAVLRSFTSVHVEPSYSSVTPE